MVYPNGSYIRVDDILAHIIKATLVSGKHSGTEIVLPKIQLVSSDSLCRFTRWQFPITVRVLKLIHNIQITTYLNLPTCPFSLIRWHTPWVFSTSHRVVRSNILEYASRAISSLMVNSMSQFRVRQTKKMFTYTIHTENIYLLASLPVISYTRNWCQCIIKNKNGPKYMILICMRRLHYGMLSIYKL